MTKCSNEKDFFSFRDADGGSSQVATRNSNTIASEPVTLRPQRGLEQADIELLHIVRTVEMIVNKSWQQNQGLLSFLYSLWCKYVEVGSLMAKKTKQNKKLKLKNSVRLFYLNVKPLWSFPEDTQLTLSPAGEC